MKMRLVYVNNDIIKKYQLVDDRVLNNNKIGGYKRPYIAITNSLDTKDIIWAIPIASYNSNRAKKSLSMNPWCFLLVDTKSQIKAVLQFNNMIPLKTGMFSSIDIKQLDHNYQRLLILEYRILRSNESIITDKIIYSLTNHYYKTNCNNFSKLIRKCNRIK